MLKMKINEQRLSDQINEWQDMRTTTVLGLESCSVINENAAELERTVKNKIFIVLDEDHEEFPMTQCLHSNIYLEITECLLTYKDPNDMKNFGEINMVEILEFELETLEWDDASIPDLVLEKYMNTIDKLGLGFDLVEWYGDLEEISFSDFPNRFRPLIESSITSYQKYNSGK